MASSPEKRHEYYLKNKEQLRAKHKAYYFAHKEKQLAIFTAANNGFAIYLEFDYYRYFCY